jgi:hypothetical protein
MDARNSIAFARASLGFAVQQLDGRLKFSGATLFCIAGFCIFPIAASVLRAWSEVREARAIDRIGGF